MAEDAEEVKPKLEAEAEEDENPEENPDLQEPAKLETKYKEEMYDNPKCNMRIEELAKPKKYRVKQNYKDHKKVLPERNMKAILMFLREEFAKAPEETEIKFKDLIDKYNIKKCRRVCQRAARKQQIMKNNEKTRKNMLKILTNILKKYIARAYFNPKQIIMTTRLRRISNAVLKELCKIRGIPVPKRESTNIRALLMFSTSDYFAYCIDMIYYELQVQKVNVYEKLARNIRIEAHPEETKDET